MDFRSDNDVAIYAMYLPSSQPLVPILFQQQRLKERLLQLLTSVQIAKEVKIVSLARFNTLNAV